MDIQIPISQKEQKAGITLQEQIDIPIQQPEYSYLNQFIDREDTTWQEIVLAEDGWDYKQEGLTPAGAAIVGSQTVGAMAGAAFSSLTNLASVSLINNQGDVEAILKELGPKDNVKQFTLAITSAGISHKIDKSLGLKGIDITQTGFDQRLVKVIANSTSTSLLQTAVYGSDFEENLKKNLRMQFATVATQDTFSNIVKDLDGDTLSDNITHKLAAGLTGCLSAKAAGNRCEAGSIGAVVGEMWGDYQVDDSNTLTQAQKDKLINQAKLIAGITAVFAGEDVNVAAGVAAEAVRWNGTAQIFYYNELEEIKNDIDGTYVKEQLNLIKNIPNAVAQVVKDNDMTIISFNMGMVGYTAIVNNKNGNVWITGVEKETLGGQVSYRAVPEVGINLNFKEITKGIQGSSRSPARATRMVNAGISINFGNIRGKMEATDIDPGYKRQFCWHSDLLWCLRWCNQNKWWTNYLNLWCWHATNRYYRRQHGSAFRRKETRAF